VAFQVWEVAVVIEYFQTSSKKGRGRSQKSIELISAMTSIAEDCHPITGRGIGYKLFTRGLIDSMSVNNMQTVYRLLKKAREEGTIDWNYIVDETREVESVPTWDDPEDYARSVADSYRKDFWRQQPHRVQVWSEKGTVRGILKPVLDKYAVDFQVMHGFGSATCVYNVCQDNDGRDLHILYVGDFDPSGGYMSLSDLPKRFEDYGGNHIKFRRIALLGNQVRGLPSFPVANKPKDPRFKWFRERFGDRGWELDAMDPNNLRDVVEEEIKKLINLDAWSRCETVNSAEQESIQNVVIKWRVAMNSNEDNTDIDINE
jgi:hypothetical protein